MHSKKKSGGKGGDESKLEERGRERKGREEGSGRAGRGQPRRNETLSSSRGKAAEIYIIR